MFKKKEVAKYPMYIDLSEKRLNIPDEKLVIGAEYYLVTDPDIMYRASVHNGDDYDYDVSFPVLVDGAPLKSNDTKYLRNIFEPSCTLHAVILGTAHYEDRTVVHFRLSTVSTLMSEHVRIRRNNEQKYALNSGYQVLSKISGDEEYEERLRWDKKYKKNTNKDVPVMLITRDVDDITSSLENFVVDKDDDQDDDTNTTASGIEDLLSDDDDGEIEIISVGEPITIVFDDCDTERVHIKSDKEKLKEKLSTMLSTMLDSMSDTDIKTGLSKFDNISNDDIMEMMSDLMPTNSTENTTEKASTSTENVVTEKESDEKTPASTEK